jgi:opacity protein-like surface antigen
MSEAQFDDNDALFGGSWDYPADDPAPAPAPPANTWDSSPEPAPAPAAKPAPAPKPANAAKPPKAPKAQKAPKTAPVTADDGTLNIFGNLGWGLGMGGYYIGSTDAYVNSQDAQTNELKSTKDHYMNLGQGLRAEAGAGYMLSSNVEGRASVDVNIGLFAPKTGKEYPPNANNENSVVLEDTANSYYSWSIKLLAIPQFEVLEMFDMYLGAGLSLSFAGSSYNTTLKRTNNATYTTAYDREFSPALGFCGIAGMLFPLSEEMSFFTELQFDVVSFQLNNLKYKSHSPPNSNIGTPPNYEKNSKNGDAPPKIPGSNVSLRAGIKLWVM